MRRMYSESVQCNDGTRVTVRLYMPVLPTGQNYEDDDSYLCNVIVLRVQDKSGSREEDIRFVVRREMLHSGLVREAIEWLDKEAKDRGGKVHATTANADV